MKIGAFVVTHRRPDHLVASLRALLAQTLVPDLLLVVDNADDPATAAAVRALGPPVVYEASGANLGSAGGTERGVRRLYEEGCDVLYLGDDDNPPRTADTVERLVDLLAAGGPDVGGTGALGSLWDWRCGELVRLPDEQVEGVLEVDFIGGNHTLTMPRRVVAEVGFPAGELFFGYPDLEYCLRLRQAGYRLLVDGELMLRHRAETGRLGLTVGRTPRPRRPRTAIWRNYYTTRNYIHMMRTTFGRPDLARREALKALGRAAAGWSRGPGYGWEFARLELRGIRDGFAGRLGPRVPPRAKYPERR